MKTIFFVVFNRFIFTNIINTDVFRVLSQRSDLKIVLFVPDYKKDFFVQQINNERVIIEGVDLSSMLHGSWCRVLHELAQPLIPGPAVDWRIDVHRYNKQYKSYIITKILNRFFSRSRLVHRVFRAVDNFFTPYGFLRPYAEKYKPDYLFATDIFNEADAFMLMEAKTIGIPIYGMVRSWDNATTKGLLRCIPERIVCASPFIKYELIQYHGVDKDRIDIGGYPQYDAFVKPNLQSRTEFCQKMGLDPAKKIVLFGPAGNAFHVIDWQILRQLQNMLNDGTLPDNIQFLIRAHPLSQPDLSQFKTDPRFIIDIPGIHFKINPKAAEMVAEDVDHLVNSIYHSDIVLYGVSSLCLDATMFLKPQIMLAMDGYQQNNYLTSVRRYQDEEHLLYFRNTGAVRIASSWFELAALIKVYLDNPDIDKSGRLQALRSILGSHDGHDGQRIGRQLLAYFGLAYAD